MEDSKVYYRNCKFSNKKVELDEKSFIHCEFESCIIILERGETKISIPLDRGQYEYRFFLTENSKMILGALFG